jgi:D-glycero-alpha-D-manno-heptose-7-phosphate kinase
VLKREIDGDETVREALSEIVNITRELSNQISNGNLDSLGELLIKEWDCRKKLSPNITTDEIDKIIEFAKSKGASGYKVCGAGGGGCILIFSGDSQKMDSELKQADFHVVDYNFVPDGLLFS